MITGHVFIATSLDGYVARADRGLDWLDRPAARGEDHGYDAFFAGVDGIVTGSGSFRTVLGFETWPYAKPMVVMSDSLTAADVPEPLRGRVRIVKGSPR